ATLARPRLAPTGCSAGDHLERCGQGDRETAEVGEARLVGVDPRRGEHDVAEAPAQPHATVQTAVLVEPEQRLRVGDETAEKPRAIVLAQVAAKLRGIGERTRDA